MTIQTWYKDQSEINKRVHKRSLIISMVWKFLECLSRSNMINKPEYHMEELYHHWNMLGVCWCWQKTETRQKEENGESVFLKCWKKNLSKILQIESNEKHRVLKYESQRYTQIWKYICLFCVQLKDATINSELKKKIQNSVWKIWSNC